MSDSDYETTQRTRNLIVGGFVIIGLCVFGWLVFQFGDLPTAVRKFNSFDVYVQFASAHGIHVDTPVSFCGYQIGDVTEIFSPEVRTDLFTNQQYHQIVAVLSIDNEYKNIPSNAKVKLMTRGLSSSYIEITVDPSKPLKPLDPNKPETAFLTEHMLLQGSTGMTSEFFPEESQEKLDELITGLNVLMMNANSILGDPNNQQNFSTSLENLTKTTEQATKTLKQLESFFAAGTSATEQLNKTIVEMQLILDKINTGTGTVGRFVNDAQFYEGLLENSKQFNILLQDLKTFINKLNEKGIKIKL